MRIVLLFSALLLLPAFIFAQDQFSSGSDPNVIEVQDAPEMEVIAFSKTVIIRTRAKAVFVLGGDVIIEGRVEGDVGVIGGNVIQREGAFVGGDVIVIGGGYRPESPHPNRGEGKQTVVFGIFEDELREFAKDPTQLFSPSFTPAFFAQRILSVLFWFVVTLAVSTIAPGAVSRAIARSQLSPAKVAGLGLAGLILAIAGVIVSFSVLPDYVSAIIWLMTFAILMLAYLFGRVALQLSVGKVVQKHLFPGKRHPESIAILFGVLIWTILLSIPYIWTLALLTLFAAGVGLVLTARGNGTSRTA